MAARSHGRHSLTLRASATRLGRRFVFVIWQLLTYAQVALSKNMTPSAKICQTSFVKRQKMTSRQALDMRS